MTIITAPVTGNVWKIEVSVGDQVNEEDELIILESMKMEIPVVADRAGTVEEILVSEGEVVEEGAVVARLAD